MQNIAEIKEKVYQMSGLALSMWRITHEAFLQHDLDLLTDVLENENKLNNLEKEISLLLVSLGKQGLEKKEKDKIILYENIASDFEIIGDYCKDILERVQIKIEEKLMFSEEAVSEYEVLYKKTENILDEINSAMERNSFSILKDFVKNKKFIDKMINEYRSRHNQRLINGICVPIACNMFLNMLDFTAEVYHHAQEIAGNLIKSG